MLIALTTGHKIGLITVAAIFVTFALLSSMVIPRYRPDFPGRGLPFFLLATFGLFVAMFSAVLVFGRESEEAEAGGAKPAGGQESGGVTTVPVSETEFKIALPKQTFRRGTYEFDVENNGKLPHDLTINGPEVQNEKTPVFDAGTSQKLKVTLVPGIYDFYCSVPGHKEAGMDVKVRIV